MGNPLASLVASVKLRCSTNPPQVITTDYNGSLVTVLKVSGVKSLPPAGASPTGTVTKTVKAMVGKAQLFLAAGLTPAEVLVNSTLTAAEFSDTVVVESVQVDTTKTGCTYSTTGEYVKIPTTATNDGLIAGAKVSGTSIAATATILTVNNLKYTTAVTSVGTTTITVDSGSITLVAGQFVSINGTAYTVSAAVTNSATFVIVGTPPPAGTYAATIGALLVLGLADVANTGAITADQTSQTLTVGGYITVSDVAIGSLSSGSYSFDTYSAIRTFADVRDGDYFEMAVGTGVFPENPPTAYVYLQGYVRRADDATKTFLVWDSEVGGSPVKEIASGFPWFATAVTSEAPYINVYQKKNLIFSFASNTRLTGRLNRAPALSLGTPTIRFQHAHLRGRLNKAPALLGLAANDYIRIRPASVIGRMARLPALGTVESNMTIEPAYLTGRLATPPHLTGGYLRAPAAASEGRVFFGTAQMVRNCEDFSVSGRVTASTPLAVLSGNEELRRGGVPIRALVRGTATFVMLGRGLSVRDVIDDCLGVWNIRKICNTQDDIKERSIADLNAAMQVIYSRARHLSYFNSATISIQVGTSGQADLPNTIQTVIGLEGVKATEESMTLRPLTPIGTFAEWRNFALSYGSHSQPLGYYIDRRTQPEANATKSTLLLAPAPAATVYVDVIAAMEAPRYTWRDYELATPLQLPVAYAESLLMPIVRQRATGFRLFVNDALRGTIEAHYKKAQMALGLVDSVPNQSADKQTKDVEGRD